MKKFMVKLLTNQKWKPENLNDVAMDQSVNQLRQQKTIQNVLHIKKVQEEVDIIWWFDIGTDAHEMPKYVGERT